jgi:L-ascorbate metabolism protein UlaG (beta-lactamase superfamily)
MALFSVLGKAATGQRLERMVRSPNYKLERFQNLVPTEVTLKDASFFRMLREYRNRPANTAPAKALPVMKTDLSALPDKGAWFVWFGHSSYLLKMEGVTILVDPVFSGNASPVSFLARAFPGTSVYDAAAMPSIDVLLLTHDHYDHLDYKTVKSLAPAAGRICTSLGVGAHLESWGVAQEKIVELDWWEQWSWKDLTFTAAPARHFSGRTFKRGGTLWSSFVLKGRGHSLYLGGDSGYEQHFREIGERFGPFELAILECGQYGKNWPYIHMVPEDTVQAAVDLNAAALIPVHWGKFTLSLHAWDEPVRRAVAAATRRRFPIATPMIGQPVQVGDAYPAAPWWED